MSEIRKGSEYLLVILKEERVVVVDTVENQHIEGVYYLLPTHKGL